MSLKENFLRDNQDTDILPEISSRFTPLELLGSNDFGQTFLLSENITNDLYVLKSYAGDAKNEAELLHGLSHKGLPAFEKAIEHMGRQYVLRKHISGETLESYDDPSISTVLKLDILIQLCDVVIYIHSLPQPIIHRDIKPSNIIINPETNDVTLIDFGISRIYDKNAAKDTVYFGTNEFAPPEQYGFAQTDQRTDIYSLGIVMKYLFTTQRWPEHIAEKCTQLSPNARFQSAAALKRALLNYKNRVRRRVTAVAVCILALCVTFLVVPAASNLLSEPAPQPFFEISQDEFRQFALYRHSDFLRQRYHVVYTYIAGEGLRLSGRNNTWETIDFYIGAFPPGEYLLVVDFYAEDDSVVFELGISEGPPWGIFAHTSENTIEYNLQIEAINGENKATVVLFDGAQSYQRAIQLQTNYIGRDVPYPDFIIRSIRLYEKDTPSYIPTLLTHTLPDEATTPQPLPFFEISEAEFIEFATNGGIARTEFLRRAGMPTLTFIEGEGLLISDRYNAHYAVDLYVYALPPGQYVLEIELASDDEDIIYRLTLTEGPPWSTFLDTQETTIRYNLLIEEVDGQSRANIVSVLGEQRHLRRIRIQTDQRGDDVLHPDFMIRSIRLYE
ncbi:MAG: protein kinase [Defluviitaleaceae bacterium]|nr:protein kinase [Defluviitaleaceae bacterium]